MIPSISFQSLFAIEFEQFRSFDVQMKIFLELFLFSSLIMFVSSQSSVCSLALKQYLHSDLKNIPTLFVDFMKEYFVDDLISNSCENSSTSYEFQKGSDNFNSLKYRSKAIIFVQNSSKLASAIDSFQSPKVFYTIIIKKVSKFDLKILFQKLWRKNIFNVNVLKIEENCKKIYTFLPFQDGKCFNTDPVIINEFSKSWKRLDFFPEKLKNLYNCTVKASALNNPNTVIKTVLPDGSLKLNGTEIKLIRELAKALKFHVEIDCSETLHGTIFNNGTSTQNINRIHDGSDDLILGSYYLRAVRAMFLSYSQFYRLDHTKVIGPLDPLFTPSEILIKPFEPSLWTLLASVCIFGVICVPVVRKIRFGRFHHDSSSIQYINLLIIFLGGSQVKLPRRNFNRILLVIFAIFCIVMRTAYQGKLFAFMQNGNRQKGPTEIDEMIDRNYNFYMTESFTEFTSELRVRERLKQ
jgi:hypothetical protein